MMKKILVHTALTALLSMFLSGTLSAQDAVSGATHVQSNGYEKQDNKVTEAKFPGGNPALVKYLSENLRYPEKAEGTATVYVSFIVTTDGKVGNVHVAKKVDPLFDEEAVRVVTAMNEKHTWEPAIQNGKKIKSKVMLPIQFMK